MHDHQDLCLLHGISSVAPWAPGPRAVRAVMDDERENLTWQGFGTASRELAEVIAADGFDPDLILSIARGGLFLAASLGDALAVKNRHETNVRFSHGGGT